MNKMIISYLSNNICFCDASYRQNSTVPTGYAETDDSDLELCFGMLLDGKDVWVWCHHGIRHLHEYLKPRYTYVRAAGGVVEAPDGDRLMIFREGMWDLPKGMVEAGETLRQAAAREVKEETGIHDLSVNSLITKTYHIYDKYGGWHLKQTSWYRIGTPCKTSATPQEEEGISQAVWVSADTCRQRLQESFASLKIVSQCLSPEKTTIF